MNGKVQHNITPEQPGGVPCGLTVEQVAHLAILKLGIAGFSNRIFELDAPTLEMFAKFLLTPKQESVDIHRWLVAATGKKVGRSSVYRFSRELRQAADSLVGEAATGLAGDRPRKPFPAGAGNDRAMK